MITGRNSQLSAEEDIRICEPDLGGGGECWNKNFKTFACKQPGDHCGQNPYVRGDLEILPLYLHLSCYDTYALSS
jgi:hypothetical protein